MYFFARLRIDLQISIFVFSHELLVFRIYHREYVKSARYTPLTDQDENPRKHPNISQTMLKKRWDIIPWNYCTNPCEIIDKIGIVKLKNVFSPRWNWTNIAKWTENLKLRKFISLFYHNFITVWMKIYYVYFGLSVWVLFSVLLFYRINY